MNGQLGLAMVCTSCTEQAYPVAPAADQACTACAALRTLHAAQLERMLSRLPCAASLLSWAEGRGRALEVRCGLSRPLHSCSSELGSTEEPQLSIDLTWVLAAGAHVCASRQVACAACHARHCGLGAVQDQLPG